MLSVCRGEVHAQDSLSLKSKLLQEHWFTLFSDPVLFSLQSFWTECILVYNILSIHPGSLGVLSVSYRGWAEGREHLRMGHQPVTGQGKLTPMEALSNFSLVFRLWGETRVTGGNPMTT